MAERDGEVLGKWTMRAKKGEILKGFDLVSLEKMIVSSQKKHDFSKSKMFLWY